MAFMTTPSTNKPLTSIPAVAMKRVRPSPASSSNSSPPACSRRVVRQLRQAVTNAASAITSAPTLTRSTVMPSASNRGVVRGSETGKQECATSAKFSMSWMLQTTGAPKSPNQSAPSGTACSAGAGWAAAWPVMPGRTWARDTAR